MVRSWGVTNAVKPKKVQYLSWQPEVIDWEQAIAPLLVYGLGRSYGDTCLTSGTLLHAKELDHIISFDRQHGEITCEAGVSLSQLLPIIVPQGWFLPVTPGTQFVTLGGAIANDVHGKNHHAMGSFGCHVIELALLRSNGELKVCSLSQNAELFRATIGGLGLTGIIVWARLKLIPIKSAMIQVNSIKFSHIDEYFAMVETLDSRFAYSVSWLDCLSQGKRLGRGIYLGGHHIDQDDGTLGLDHTAKLCPKVGVPFYAPSWALSHSLVKWFNFSYYHKQLSKYHVYSSYLGPYFYPLDAVQNWNRIYGRRGLLQYQFVIPYESGHAAFKAILAKISAAGKASFLAVLKNFGNICSPGYLSFPRPGYTLALDFPNAGKDTLTLLQNLDEMVAAYGGAIYPAKDARMSSQHFKAFFPNWEKLTLNKDPAFSSYFWERVTHGR